MTRRELLAGFLASRWGGPLVDSHIHLFDPVRFPYHRNATYQPPAERLDEYAGFVKTAGIDHAIVVHPEPYQDDHRYLEYCFEHEPSRGFFKGTCLFDPLSADTPARMEALVKKHARRIVAVRVHEIGELMHDGAIKNRDPHSPGMKAMWTKADQLGIAVQVHMQPRFAPQIAELAQAFPRVTVIIDHLGRAGEGSAADADSVVRLGKLPRTVMKYSGASLPSLPLVRRLFDAFGAERMIWGGLGMNAKAFSEQTALFEKSFAFASEEDRKRLRGGNAIRLFGWT